MLPADRGLGLAAGADVIGALLVTAGLMLGIYTVVTVEEHGRTSAPTLGFGALATVLLVGFVARQATAKDPLMPLRIFRSRNVSGANLVQMLMVAALFSFQIIVALYLQKVLGYGAAKTGLAGGFGLALPALTTLGMSGAGDNDAGLASGLFNTTQQIGMALGVAVLSTLAAARTDGLLADGEGQAAALTGGYHLAFTVGAGLLVAAFVVAFTVLRQRKRGPSAGRRPSAGRGPSAGAENDNRRPRTPEPGRPRHRPGTRPAAGWRRHRRRSGGGRRQAVAGVRRWRAAGRPGRTRR